MKTTSMIVITASLLLSSAAWAQPETTPDRVRLSSATPDLSAPADTISMAVGQARQLNFKVPFDQIHITSDKVAVAKPVTDHVMTVQALAAGETIISVMTGGKELYSAMVVVDPEPGHLVRLYGAGKNDDANAGHIAVFCNEVGCGRPDKDLPRPTISVERISRGPKDRP